MDGEAALRLDRTTLKRATTRHTDERLKQIENDMIWEGCALGDPERVLYLMLEFQSRPDWTMALRMWNYFGQLQSTLAKREDCQQGRKLRWVRPIVLYNGERGWTEARDLADLAEGAPTGWKGPGPQLHHKLVDVVRGPELNPQDRPARQHGAPAVRRGCGQHDVCRARVGPDRVGAGGGRGMAADLRDRRRPDRQD